jgi:hypothetical protein
MQKKWEKGRRKEEQETRRTKEENDTVLRSNSENKAESEREK